MMGLRDTLPDAPTESGSAYNGFLSYASEWHASAVGLAGGLLGALLYGTAFETFGLLVIATVVAQAFGLQFSSKLRGKVGAEVDAEPWYALAALVIGFALGIIGVTIGIPME